MSELTEEMIDSIFAADHRREHGQRESAPATADDLRALYASWNTGYDFKPGDIVRPKPGLQGFYSIPLYDQPCVVMEILDQPIRHPDPNPGKPTFRFVLDIVIGFVDKDGDFLFYHQNSRQFEPFE